MSSEICTVMDFSNIGIPDLSEARKRKERYSDELINEFNPRYDEELIDVRDLGISGANYYWGYDTPVPGAIEALLVRKRVGELLHSIDLALRIHGLKLFVKDAYRPTEVQEYVRRQSVPRKLRQEFPNATPEEIEAMVPRYAGVPSTDPERPSPHLTGGAVDLIIKTVDGNNLDFGQQHSSAHIENRLWPDAFHNKMRQHNRKLEDKDWEAMRNRSLLYNLMCESGFVGNPTEWWHYSFGDQMWARLTGSPSFYGPAPYKG